MTSLLERLKGRDDIELAVVTTPKVRDACFKHARFKADGVQYFILPTPWRRVVRRCFGRPTWAAIRSEVEQYASVVKQWNPDVVHVHGTEMDYGLIKAWGLTDKPVAVSIQGLMAPYAGKVYGDVLPSQIDGSGWRVLGLKPSCRRDWEYFHGRMPVEEAILRSADMVLGRTEWDHAWAWAFRPDVVYRQVDELMRPEFYQAVPWNVADCRRHQIFCTSGSQPLKGLHILLEAVRRLRQVYPDVKLNVACGGFLPRAQNDYARFVLRLVRGWELEDAVCFLGLLDADAIVAQLRQAHCYVTPSFIENSCNALQEAMLVGTPSVASLSGGLITVIDSGQTGLTFPTGDAALLASQIHRLFQNDDLAVTIGAEAMAVARSRLAPDRVEGQLLRAYEELAGIGAPQVKPDAVLR